MEKKTIFAGNRATVDLSIWFEFQFDISKRSDRQTGQKKFFLRGTEPYVRGEPLGYCLNLINKDWRFLQFESR